jgi:DNA-binding XRE family transcriptional regulator
VVLGLTRKRGFAPFCLSVVKARRREGRSRSATGGCGGASSTAYLWCYTVPCRIRGMEITGDAAGAPRRGRRRPRRPTWEASSVRALRHHLGLSQRDMAEEMGVRQQTVSEWETGLYRPRGASARLLAIIAERASFEYSTENSKPETREA